MTEWPREKDTEKVPAFKKKDQLVTRAWRATKALGLFNQREEPWCGLWAARECINLLSVHLFGVPAEERVVSHRAPEVP